MSQPATVRTACMALAVSALLAGCASDNIEDAWACRIDPRAGSCSTIDEIDRNLAGGPAMPVSGPASGRGVQTAIVDGAAPARWWQAANMTGGAVMGAPQREGDQVMKVVVAPWIDAVGDYHARTEVHSVMRKGGWWLTGPHDLRPTGQVAVAAAPAPTAVPAAPTSGAVVAASR